ncbi:MAG TPA: DUF1254 domain-containing protein [Polyangiaceae bacterium]|nr:DUF1254 domain-containing protein [Polyangiaceae bacterium]
MKAVPVVACVLGVGVVIALASTAARSGTQDESEVPPGSEAEALDIGIDAYVFGYPLVTMEVTRRVMTNVATPAGARAPMGQFANLRTYPSPEDRDVTTPNADTLYSTAWLDLSREPYVLSLPEMSGRYYLMPMLDAWTNVFQAPGKRTTGTGPQKYAITGPGWRGTLPAGVVEYKSPTNTVWVLGRIYSAGTPEDYDEVHKIQDQLSLVPLSAYGKPYAAPPGSIDPATDMKTAVRDQVDRMDMATYFGIMAEALKNNAPAPVDAPMVQKIAKIGIVPGQDFDASKLPPGFATALKAAPKLAHAKILGHVKDSGALENGWIVTTRTGQYGTEYLQRATVAAMGLGANLPRDAVYPTTEKDADGHDYIGIRKYVIHFDNGMQVPVKAFWSLTMYDDKYFFVPNPLHRYTLSQRNKFMTNPDGSVDLYLQRDNPGGDKEANWLPTPLGKFVPVLRLYWPTETDPSILDATWKPPQVKRTE